MPLRPGKMKHACANLAFGHVMQYRYMPGCDPHDKPGLGHFDYNDALALPHRRSPDYPDHSCMTPVYSTHALEQPRAPRDHCKHHSQAEHDLEGTATGSNGAVARPDRH